jgi:hypothetical protein
MILQLQLRICMGHKGIPPSLLPLSVSPLLHYYYSNNPLAVFVYTVHLGENYEEETIVMARGEGTCLGGIGGKGDQVGGVS